MGENKFSASARPIHVLQMVPLGAGGITSLVLNLAEHSNKDKIIFDYLTFYNRKEFNEDKALSYGGKKIVVPIDKYNNGMLRAIYKFIGTITVLRKEKPDIVHINASFPYDILIGLSAKLAGVKVVIFHSHNSNMKNRKSLKGKIMLSFRPLISIISDVNIACSRLAAEFMFPKKIVNSCSYTILNNGIDASRYEFSESIREVYRKKLKLETKTIYGHIGRFTTQKNHKFLVDIFFEIKKINSEAVLLLIGIGELQEQVRKQVDDLGLSDSVIFYGATNEVPQLLQAMDCFVFPSLYEGLPVVGVEVQAAGLPIIMSDSITNEVAITEYAKSYSLKETARSWALEIEMHRNRYSRRSTLKEIQNAGFDIVDVSNKLENIYRSSLEDK